MSETLLDRLRLKSNDYSELERELYRGVLKAPTISCSVVIPFHGEVEFLACTLAALRAQDCKPKFLRDKVEIIVVDDGSGADIDEILRKTARVYPVTYLAIKKNMGRSVARNVGVLHAKNDVIVFLDADIITQRSFLRTHLLWQSLTEKAVVVGMRHKVDTSFMRSKFAEEGLSSAPTPDYRSDFRYEKFVPEEWEAHFPDIAKEEFDKRCRIFDRTSQFKDFGFYKSVGVWRLPSMMLTANVSARRSTIIRVGGFDMAFQGWGMEDAYLGAKLIAAGHYVIPDLRLTAFHVMEELSENELAARRQEMRHNERVYFGLLLKQLPDWSEEAWKASIRKITTDKVMITHYS